MKPRISVITLGVNDLEKSLAFYRYGLGLQTNGIIGTEFKGDETHPSGAAAMFELQNGVILALYPRTELAKDAKEPVGVSSPIEFSVGHLVQNKEEVDALIRQAEIAGATVTDGPHDRPWGIYSGYFKDLDGHLWEIIFNPEMLPDPDPQVSIRGSN
jgi:catechol 2,3-dioxygenase-like lactoylglutathione lyase family enzyme